MQVSENTMATAKDDYRPFVKKANMLVI
jgi:hypothetical protein